MSKKMWNKIFKNKSTKNSKNLTAANKVNKRCSIYEEYQQLNALLQQQETPLTDEPGGTDAKIYENKNATNIEDEPLPTILASSISSLTIGQPNKQSKFSKVVNTLTLKRNHHREHPQQQLLKTPKAAASKGKPKISTKKKHDEPIANSAAPIELTEAPDPTFVENLTPCHICQRRFNPVTLQKHVPICERSKAKKRKVFDSSRQRREGTELASFLPKGFGLPQSSATKAERSLSPNPQKLSSPRLPRKKSSEEFVRTTARSSMRQLSTSSLNNGPSTSQAAANSTKPAAGAFVRDRLRSSERGASKRSLTPMAEQCPHCERCFGVKAYDRHVEWCKEKAIQAAIKHPTPTNEQNKAKERWEARNKYRAPNLKTKRSQNREKYAGFTGDEAESIDTPRTHSVMSQSMTSSMTSDRNNFEYCEKLEERFNETEMDSNLNMALSSDERETKKRQRPKTLTKKKSKNEIKKSCASDDMLDWDEQHYSKQQEIDRALQVDLGKTLTVVQHMGRPQSPTSTKITSRSYEDCDSGSQMQLRAKQTPLVEKKPTRPAPTRPEGKPKPLKGTASLPVLQGPSVSRHPSQTSIKSVPLKAIQSTGTIPKPNKNSRQRTSIAKAGEPMKALPLVKHNLTQATKEREIKIIKAAPSGRRQSARPAEIPDEEPPKRLISGQLDKYDPFLSAKRQLEDLCSPSSPYDVKENSFTSPTKENAHSQNQIPQSQPSTPNTPLANTKMSASFTLSTSNTSNTSNPNRTIPLTPTSLTANRLTNTTVKPGITASNFRRTSSLRGPRRSPLLSSRPLFTPSQRPTVQRGLSDEGPISTNFLKPEEYDEMPVRSACVNDAALTKSPRVVRRDTSLSNRKNNLKLDIKSPNAVQEPGTPNQPAVADVRNIAKTDSLAVFLKYETEAEKPQTTQPVVHSPQHPVNASPPLITKALKDKSNTLSKQNSAKNLTLESDLPKLLEQQTPKLPPATERNQTAMEHNEAPLQTQSNKPSQLRLEPISFTKPTTPVVQPPKPNAPFTQLPLLDRAVNLHDLFGDTKSHLHKEGKSSSSTEFIDPKLINKCDNLPVNLTSLTGRKHAESEELRQHDASSAHAEAAPISQLSKLLPLHNAGNAPTEAPRLTSTSNPPTNTIHAAQRNSAEGRNLLKRKMRLGRNQFLYDASPEADSCSAEDEANRSSVEYEAQKTPMSKTKQMPPIVPPLPIFDDFDFEEFLSSFAHDDEQFPLFKDCKDFLLNRTSSKLRSTLTSNSNANSSFQQQNNNNNNNNNINSRCKTSPSILINQSHHQKQHQQQRENQQYQQHQQYQQYQQHHTHFQFPHLQTKPADCPAFLLTPSSLRSNTTIISRGPPKLPNTLDVADQAPHNKREIFISIETEQQELGHSPISPDSLRQMVGNSQTEVEVEVDGNDNKFSKISDDEPLVSTPHLPNVELNNAKNLIQKMQDGFRQSVVTHNNNANRNNNNNNSTNAMLFGGHDSGINTSTKTDAADDSDEMSSLDGYPIVSKSNRRGVASKLSADSAYGSLSRQRSTESASPRSLNRSRPSTTASAQTQHQQQQQAPPGFTNKYSNIKARSRQFTKDSSSSGSDRSLPPIGGGGGDGPQNFRRFDRANNNYNRQSPSPTPEMPRERTNSLSMSGGMAHLETLNSNNSTSSSTMSSSAKLSKFCHECGGKYIIERAKFCTDCGVRRIVL